MNNRISRFAKFFRALFLFFLIVTPILIGTLWLSGGEIAIVDGDQESAMNLLAFDFEFDEKITLQLPLPWEIRLLGLAATFIPLGIGMLCLWWLVRLFSCFANGEIFTKSTVKYIRYLGWTMVAGVVATPIYEALLSFVLTMHNSPGERLVSISLESADFEELITAGIIILISWVMEEGRKLREADELTV